MRIRIVRQRNPAATVAAIAVPTDYSVKLRLYSALDACRLDMLREEVEDNRTTPAEHRRHAERRRRSYYDTVAERQSQPDRPGLLMRALAAVVPPSWRSTIVNVTGVWVWLSE
ncbi:hypothetical protein CSOJ01_12843 [Colletotrichum sojae]|uniref:Uncharacterized protein n=1 Tax=Colletotrichum sojae TaxID=2175907 RepID=A0A8H6IUR8_9PEZI|nr:hypothetical protein CSOJ01_12843 [Colletotrichum sojae]